MHPRALMRQGPPPASARPGARAAGGGPQGAGRVEGGAATPSFPRAGAAAAGPALARAAAASLASTSEDRAVASKHPPASSHHSASATHRGRHGEPLQSNSMPASVNGSQVGRRCEPAECVSDAPREGEQPQAPAVMQGERVAGPTNQNVALSLRGPGRGASQHGPLANRALDQPSVGEPHVDAAKFIR